MEDSVETAGIVDGLLVPHNIPLVLPAADFPVLCCIFDSFPALVALRRRNHKNEGEGRSGEMVWPVERQDVHEAERRRDAEESDQLVEDVGIGLERDEVFPVKGHGCGGRFPFSSATDRYLGTLPEAGSGSWPCRWMECGGGYGTLPVTHFRSRQRWASGRSPSNYRAGQGTAMRICAISTPMAESGKAESHLSSLLMDAMFSPASNLGSSPPQP